MVCFVWFQQKPNGFLFHFPFLFSFSSTSIFFFFAWLVERRCAFRLVTTNVGFFFEIWNSDGKPFSNWTLISNWIRKSHPKIHNYNGVTNWLYSHITVGNCFHCVAIHTTAIHYTHRAQGLNRIDFPSPLDRDILSKFWSSKWMYRENDSARSWIQWHGK